MDRKHRNLRAAALTILVLAAAVGTFCMLPWLEDVMTSQRDWLGLTRGFADQLRGRYATDPVGAMMVYALVLFVAGVIDVPSPSLVELAGAAVLGFWPALLVGLPVVALAALVPFFLTRHWLGPTLEGRFPEKAIMIKRGVGRDGPLYLVSLRLMPGIPFIATNVFMALTPIRVWVFFVINIVARIPMTAIMCNAGMRLGDLKTLDDLVAMPTVLTFAAVALGPLAVRYAWSRYSRDKRL